MALSTSVKRSSINDRIAFWLIMLIPVLWGAGFPLTHNAVAIVDPGLHAFSRSFVGLLILLPFAIGFLAKSNSVVVVGGTMLGLSNAMSVVGQSYALSHLNSATTAFLVTLNILFVPFLTAAMKIGRISVADLLSVVLGLAGAYVIFSGDLQSISIGYAWGILAAFAIAVNISIVGRLVANHPDIDRFSLSFYQILFTTLALSYFLFTRDLSPLQSPPVWGAVLYQGIFSTALAIFLQVKFQQRVGSTRTAVIFNLDLVFASLFGLVNKEPLTMAQVSGGALIFIASLIENLVLIIGTRYRTLRRRYS